ncbi:MAG: 5-oxoprolinase subunit PxpA [Lachnospiraceae bacterium]
MNRIDMNSDLAESYGAYHIGNDEKILAYVTSANLACGFHASDPVVMEKSVKLCREHHVAVGAHPGFPDLQGFGRRNMVIPPDEVKSMVMYQIGALEAFCRANGLTMQHVKPHGALYNMAGKDYALAKAVCQAIAEINPGLILMAQAGSQLQKAGEELHLTVAKEIFADRAYEEDGSLVARSKPGAVITDEEEAIRRVITMIRKGKTTAVTGKEIPIEADTVCVHGDGEKALLFVQKLRMAFAAEGIAVQRLQDK